MIVALAMAAWWWDTLPPSIAPFGYHVPVSLGATGGDAKWWQIATNNSSYDAFERLLVLQPAAPADAIALLVIMNRAACVAVGLVTLRFSSLQHGCQFSH